MRQEQHARRGPKEIRHAWHAGMPHGAWLQLDAAMGLQQNVGGHGTRLPGWGGCVSGPRFPLPGSRQTDRHNHVPNAESGTWVQAGEGVSGKLAGESKDADIRKARQFRSAFAIRLPQEVFNNAIETTCFLWRRRQITVRITARIRSRAKVGVQVCAVDFVPIFVHAHIETSVEVRFSRRVSGANFYRNHRNVPTKPWPEPDEAASRPTCRPAREPTVQPTSIFVHGSCPHDP